MQLHSEVARVRVLTYKFWRDTIQPITCSKCSAFAVTTSLYVFVKASSIKKVIRRIPTSCLIHTSMISFFFFIHDFSSSFFKAHSCYFHSYMVLSYFPWALWLLVHNYLMGLGHDDIDHIFEGVPLSFYFHSLGLIFSPMSIWRPK